MRVLFAACVLLGWASASAGGPNYNSGRKWVEDRCAANTIPQDERIFVFRWVAAKYAGIMRFHEGISLREIVDQTPLKGKVLQIIVMRTEPLRSGQYTTRHCISRVGPFERPDYKLKRQDLIWLLDQDQVINL
jgi:hypothetical protein